MSALPIVERLRRWEGDGHPHGLLHREAADIIEAAVDAVETSYRLYGNNDCACEACTQSRAFLARSRGEVVTP